jgi:hypothetical protein
MATNTNGLALISDLVEDVKGEETLFQRKANTVTSSIGVTASLILMFLTSWVESGTNIPSWLPNAVLICGLLATTYSVSKTKNGVTASVATKLQDGLAAKIDLNHIHDPAKDLVPDSPTSQPFAVDQAIELRAEANALVEYHSANE